MAGTAPTDFHFTRTRYAVPVHCSVWLSSRRIAAGRWRFTLRTTLDAGTKIISARPTESALFSSYPFLDTPPPDCKRGKRTNDYNLTRELPAGLLTNVGKNFYVRQAKITYSVRHAQRDEHGHNCPHLVADVEQEGSQSHDFQSNPP
jgi:hypothetical protein